ncbi:MAG: 23S rRNA (uracil(1939)-C(5))-methyltransferase RlmD [Thermococci archaeon]|nr:23S rRNA (uracil(1939)-C(5))-methyltransferase RlmD [Thermococci archaeon]
MGMAFLDGVEVEVPFTAPGDVVEIMRWRRRKGRRVATEYTVVERSSIRVTPGCPHFGGCGGCRAQHLPYEEQIRVKEEGLSEVLGADVRVKPSPRVYGYRNRIDLVLSTSGIGFRRFGTWWDVVDVEECKLFGPSSRRAIRSVRDLIESSGAPKEEMLYDIRRGTGFLRYMVLREGKFTGELMVTLVTSEGEFPEDPSSYFEYADSVYWSVNRTKSDVSYGEVRRFWGGRFIEERIGGVTYGIHPNSFFQTNSYQLVNLLGTVSAMVDGERVLDMYSGIGTFGVFLAKRGFRVVGVDVNPHSIEMARMNARRNGVEATFITSSDRDEVEVRGFDTVIVDPPRPGLHPKFRRRLIKEGPGTVVYVSCNPKTLRRDLEELGSRYRVEEIQGLDMFPHTPHVEVVVKLVRLTN